jgi:hypothetical protein
LNRWQPGATRGVGQAAPIELAGRDAARVRATAEEARACGSGAPVHEHVADLARMYGYVGSPPSCSMPTAHRRARQQHWRVFTSRYMTPDGSEHLGVNDCSPRPVTRTFSPGVRQMLMKVPGILLRTMVSTSPVAFSLRRARSHPRPNRSANWSPFGGGRGARRNDVPMVS